MATSSHQPEDMGKFKILFYPDHREQRRAATTAGRGGYATAVQNVYGVTPPPSEEHHKAIDHTNTIVQGI